MRNLSIVIITFLFTSCRIIQDEGKKVFYYNESSGIATLDPAFAKSQAVIWATHQLYNTLVEIDSSLQIKPSLAYRWDVNSDNTVFTFHLRSNIFFQDNPAFLNGKGRQLVAADVVYSLNRIIDPTTASSGAWIFNNRVKKNGFIAINDSTFQLQLIKPFHPILGILSMQYCSIIPKEVVEKYGNDFRRNPCGTGPFQLEYWDESQALVLKKNNHYWEVDSMGTHLPYLDAVQISFLNNKATEFLDFRQHKLSFTNDIDPSFKDEVLKKNGELRPEWQDKIVLQKHAYLNIEYFGILMNSNSAANINPLQIKKVRQALNYAVNRASLIFYMRNSIGQPAIAGFVPNGLPSENTQYVTGYNYNPNKALTLLREAGFPNGRGLPTLTLTTVPQYADIADYVARQIENIGVKIQVESIQKSLLLQQTAQYKVPFFRASWIADYPDAENYLAVFYSKNPAPPNYTHYHNNDFDLLYERSLTENNDSTRYAIYRQMDQLLINDAPVIPIFYDEVIHLVQPNIIGFTPNALNLLELRNVNIKE